MPQEGMSIDRRTVLKRISTAAVVSTGLAAASSSATAIPRKKTELVNDYHDEVSLRTAFERHGEGLRDALVAEGFVSSDFDFQSLEIALDSNVNGLEPTATDAHAGVTAIEEEGTTTALGTVSASSSTHEIALFVQPERDRAYALVEPSGGGDRVLVTESDVSPTGCSYISCGTSCSYPCYSTQKTWECDANCENCEVIETDCACRSCDCESDSSCTDSCSYC